MRRKRSGVFMQMRALILFVVLATVGAELVSQEQSHVEQITLDGVQKMHITCIQNQKEYCKDKPTGFEFNDGCRECQCKEDDSYCKTPECVHSVEPGTIPERYCADIMAKNMHALSKKSVSSDEHHEENNRHDRERVKEKDSKENVPNAKLLESSKTEEKEKSGPSSVSLLQAPLDSARPSKSLFHHAGLQNEPLHPPLPMPPPFDPRPPHIGHEIPHGPAPDNKGMPVPEDVHHEHMGRMAEHGPMPDERPNLVPPMPDHRLVDNMKHPSFHLHGNHPGILDDKFSKSPDIGRSGVEDIPRNEPVFGHGDEPYGDTLHSAKANVGQPRSLFENWLIRQKTPRNSPGTDANGSNKNQNKDAAVNRIIDLFGNLFKNKKVSKNPINPGKYKDPRSNRPDVHRPDHHPPHGNGPMNPPFEGMIPPDHHGPPALPYFGHGMMMPGEHGPRDWNIEGDHYNPFNGRQHQAHPEFMKYFGPRPMMHDMPINGPDPLDHRRHSPDMFDPRHFEGNFREMRYEPDLHRQIHDGGVQPNIRWHGSSRLLNGYGPGHMNHGGHRANGFFPIHGAGNFPGGRYAPQIHEQMHDDKQMTDRWHGPRRWENFHDIGQMKYEKPAPYLPEPWDRTGRLEDERHSASMFPPRYDVWNTRRNKYVPLPFDTMRGTRQLNNGKLTLDIFDPMRGNRQITNPKRKKITKSQKKFQDNSIFEIPIDLLSVNDNKLGQRAVSPFTDSKEPKLQRVSSSHVQNSSNTTINKTSTGNVNGTFGHGSETVLYSDPSPGESSVLPHLPPSTYIVAARVLYRPNDPVKVNSLQPVSANSDNTPPRGFEPNSYNQWQAPHNHHQEASLHETIRKMQFELERMHEKYKMCEDYRSRMRYALQSKMRHNAATSSPSMLFTSMTLFITALLWNANTLF